LRVSLAYRACPPLWPSARILTKNLTKRGNEIAWENEGWSWMRKAFFKGTVMEGGTPSEARVFIPGITRIIRWAIIFSVKASFGAIKEAISTRLIDIDWKNAHLNLENNTANQSRRYKVGGSCGWTRL